MFRIRKIYDDTLEVNRRAIEQVQEILKSRFPLLLTKEVEKLPALLKNPFKYQFRSLLFLADDGWGKIKGFALLLHDPRLNFCYLDFLSAESKISGRGIGGALYQRVREEALSLKTLGVFFECLPDDPKLCRDENLLKENRSRLKFYESYGAFPVINTAYETPVKPEDDCPPYLVFDGLGQNQPLYRAQLKSIVKAILKRKYGHLCSPQYIKMVIDSIQDNPVKFREAKNTVPDFQVFSEEILSQDKKILLIVNDRHAIHHVRERGYVESPVRVDTILGELLKTSDFQRIPARHFSDSHLLAVHSGEFFSYLKKVCFSLGVKKSVYPYVFPIRNAVNPPKELSVRAGYYCIDTFTPLNQSAFLAARHAVDCALTGAQKIALGQSLAYALIRPPGHHAESKFFGGFCYFNSAAVAAHELSKSGHVAILDLDYHHGNGQQEIFYSRRDVFTLSIHGHPNFAYPYFSGFEEEKGEGEGLGFNKNYPLPEKVFGEDYQLILTKALRKIKDYAPQFLVICLGLDTAKGDPTGSWFLKAKDFHENGKKIGKLKIPTLVIQEGGYNTRNLGINARHFLSGLKTGFFS